MRIKYASQRKTLEIQNNQKQNLFLSVTIRYTCGKFHCINNTRKKRLSVEKRRQICLVYMIRISGYFGCIHNIFQ